MQSPAAEADEAVRRYVNHALASAAALEPPRASLAHGAAGIAYFPFRHAGFGGGEPSLEAAVRWAEEAEGAIGHQGAFEEGEGPLSAVPGRALHYHEPGVWWVRALIASAADDRDGLRMSVARFTDDAADAVGTAGDVQWGSAGLLLGCAQLVETVDEPDLIAPLMGAAARLAGDLGALADRDGARPGETALGYLGAAHGWAGVAHTLLRWSQATATPPPSEALELLDRLIGLRRRSGRWPIRAGSREVWRGWCHGSAGWAQT